MENNVCPKCGTPVAENAKFCTNCGEKFVPAEQAPVVNAAPASNPEPTPSAAPASNPEPTPSAAPASNPEPTPSAAPASNPEPTPNTAPASNYQAAANTSAAPNHGFNPNPAPTYKEVPPTPPAYIPVPEEEASGKDSPYQPISAWGYVGINFIMAIPILNLVMLIVWACGGCRKVNKRNMARGFFLTMLISFIIGIIIMILGLTVFRNVYYDIIDIFTSNGYGLYY